MPKNIATMTSKEIKERDTRLIEYLFLCYPNAADLNAEDHADFIDDVTDLLLARTKRSESE